MNSAIKDRMVRLIEADARQKAAAFSIAFARAPSEEKELYLSAMEFEHWVADTCREYLQQE